MTATQPGLGRESRLPKWAWQELSILRRDLAEREAEIARLRQPDLTDKPLVYQSTYPELRPIPQARWENGSVDFLDPSQADPNVRTRVPTFSVRFDPISYRLIVTTSGGRTKHLAHGSWLADGMTVHPHSNNHIIITHRLDTA